MLVGSWGAAGPGYAGTPSHLKELGGYEANVLEVVACGPSTFQSWRTFPSHAPTALDAQNVAGGFQTQHSSEGRWHPQFLDFL